MADNWLNLSRTTDRFLSKPNWIREPKAGFDDNREIMQYAGTVIDIYNLGDSISKRYVYGYTNMSMSSIYYIVNFFCEHRGKHSRFWLPVRKNNFVLVSAISQGDRIITIENCYFNLIDQGYGRIFIELKNGDYISRSVSAVVPGTTTEDILLNDGMDRNIGLDDILFFGSLILTRFDSDSLDMDFHSDQVNSCELGFVELVHEYGLEVES